MSPSRVFIPRDPARWRADKGWQRLARVVAGWADRRDYRPRVKPNMARTRYAPSGAIARHVIEAFEEGLGDE